MKHKLVVLFGPTAVGKTALTRSLFSSGFEIINSDSIQVYEYLDIGSAKPDASLLSLIPHHLISILKPWRQYTVGDYCKDADRLCAEIADRGRIPLLTGGTAYYFRQFLFGAASTPEADPFIRQKVSRLIEENGRIWAHEELMKADPVSANRINVNDIYRVSRALEVYYQTGRPLSSFVVSKTVREDIDPVVIGLERDKKELDMRIAERVDLMFSLGLEKEIEMLMQMGAEPTWPAMQAIGYKEFFIPGLSRDEIKEKIITSSRQYAKRQMTFFRSFGALVSWFHPEDEEGIKNLLLERGIYRD